MHDKACSDDHGVCRDGTIHVVQGILVVLGYFKRGPYSLLIQLVAKLISHSSFGEDESKSGSRTLNHCRESMCYPALGTGSQTPCLKS